MPVNLDLKTRKDVAELVARLDARTKRMFWAELVDAMKEPGQLEELLAAAEQRLADILLNEEEDPKIRAKFEYKEVDSNFYAYIRLWGETQLNLYIGPMRFLPGVRYRLTHKNSREVKTLVGMGLYRDEEQVYLKIQHLTPTDEIKSYLFYDRTQRFPRRPQEDVIEINFSKKEWKIENLGLIEGLEGAVVETLTAPVDVDALKAPIPRFESPAKQQKIEVQVKSKSVTQVKDYMTQWAVLSRALPTNPQWELSHLPNRILLHREGGEMIVEFNSSSRTLSNKSPRLLLSNLDQIMFKVASSALVNREQQSVASRWLLRLQRAPKTDNEELLNYLFNL